jgi:hypothetical protein
MRRLSLALPLFAAVLAAPAAAQFNRGILRDSVEVLLFPIQAPEALLPTGSFRVDLKNTSSAPARIADQLQSGLTRQIAENDSRVRSSPQADFVVIATITEWSQRRRTGTKYVSQQRQVGTKQVKDSKGNWKTEPVYEYGRNEPTVVQEGSASIRLEVRQVSTEARLDDLTARITYFDETLSNQSPPSQEAVEDALVDRAIRQAAGKVSPGRQPTRVLMGRSDEVDRLNGLARDRKWSELRTALEQLKPHRDPKRDAYRLHNLGVAHEAMAYETSDRALARAELKEAAALIGRAAADKPDEKYFGEAAQRVALSLHALEWIGEREMALAAKFPLKPAARTATSRPPASPPSSTVAPAPARPAPAKPANADERMTNDDVIELAKAGLDEKLLIATIKEARAVSFDLGPAGLRALLAAKVTNPVISAMRARSKPGTQ